MTERTWHEFWRSDYPVSQNQPGSCPENYASALAITHVICNSVNQFQPHIVFLRPQMTSEVS
ncbi:hypothetical protein E2C01_078183 [Portunus trituberculatus]|uniref:Uncharacterized protein n=1 Tax=Portunus trituberculatus TaxID=210409 RepID=A0A5B7II25_PORTR|nr:hypothetical protein [Portunus trituberculatus]